MLDISLSSLFDSSVFSAYQGSSSSLSDAQKAVQSGKDALYQSASSLMNSLFSSGSNKVVDTFSPGFIYNVLTTSAIAEADPNAFYISPEDAASYGLAAQSDVASQIFQTITADPNGIDVLGSIYASNGMVSFLQSASTSTFQAVA